MIVIIEAVADPPDANGTRPVVRRDGKYTVVKESTGKHTPWGVYEGERLICFCVYRKGANALVDYLLEKDAWCGLLAKKQTGKEAK